MDCLIITGHLDAIKALARAGEHALQGGNNFALRERLEAIRDALDAIERELDTPMPVPRSWARVA